MATTTTQLTLQDYLAYNDDPDRHYELLDGDLISMPPKSDTHNAIAIYLTSVRDKNDFPLNLSLPP